MAVDCDAASVTMATHPQTRTVNVEVPADPANADSNTQLLSQAGGVWFPDSAYKTAQAIRDYDQEGLPLIIFAVCPGPKT
jgi:acetyl-CoA carboxylase carboxyltransferase component